MTRCDEIRSLLTTWLDGELNTSPQPSPWKGEGADRLSADVIEAHVAGCPDCASIVAEYRAIKAAAIDDGSVVIVLRRAVEDGIDAVDPVPALLLEIRAMREEMQSLRAEVAGLRADLARRPAAPPLRTSPLSFPDAPEHSLKQYRLV